MLFNFAGAKLPVRLTEGSLYDFLRSTFEPKTRINLIIGGTGYDTVLRDLTESVYASVYVFPTTLSGPAARISRDGRPLERYIMPDRLMPSYGKESFVAFLQVSGAKDKVTSDGSGPTFDPNVPLATRVARALARRDVGWDEGKSIHEETVENLKQ